MCAQALDSTITTIAPWRDPEFLERFKVTGFLSLLLVLVPPALVHAAKRHTTAAITHTCRDIGSAGRE